MFWKRNVKLLWKFKILLNFPIILNYDISKNNPVKNVRFTIPPAWKEIRKGDTLAISFRSDFALGTAIITGISPTINEKGGFPAEAVLTKETEFPIGASVRIIPENSKKGVFINHKAIFFEGATPNVWLVTENNTLRKQVVKPGRQLGDYVEVLSGLERGFSYLVILDPTIKLENGQNIDEIIKPTTSTATTTKKVIDENKPHSHDE